MRVLFIARTYPPLIGGMEQFASDFYTNLKLLTDLELVANKNGKKTFLFFIIRLFFYLLKNARKFEIIHFSDATLAPFFPLVKIISTAKVTVTVYGLDIVYKKFGYQLWTPFFLGFADKIFPISQYTMEKCREIRIPAEKLSVILIGLDISKIPECKDANRNLLLSKIGTDLANKTILLTIGRLIRRKGHIWFIKNVFSKLPDNFVYIIAGTGSQSEEIAKTIKDFDLVGRVFMLGFISDEEKACLYQIANIFIMPNVFEKNDQEGFGIVIIEAGSYGLPVIATKIEGIVDAVIDGSTGYLVNEKDVQGFLDAIMNINLERNSIISVVTEKFDWKTTANSYFEEFKKLSKIGNY